MSDRHAWSSRKYHLSSLSGARIPFYRNPMSAQLGIERNPFAEVNEKVAIAGDFLKLKPGLVQAMSTCEREVVISIPLRRGDDVEVLTGYRVQHSSARGPRKGGIRFHQDVDLNEVRAQYRSQQSLRLQVQAIVLQLHPIRGQNLDIRHKECVIARSTVDRQSRLAWCS